MSGLDVPPQAVHGAFSDALIDWQRRCGRHDLPWQRTSDAYRIWISEIMLQQTQVATVIGYYLRFLDRFPDVDTLAAAPADAVMAAWSGLGYYSRARHLHAAARAVVASHGGVLPTDPATLEILPGIGRSTAAAIAAFSTGRRVPILDGNVKRVLCRVFGIEGFPGTRAVEQRLWSIAERELPMPAGDRVQTYTQAIMDLGATVCVRRDPRCGQCPVAPLCEARRVGRQETLPTPRPARTAEVRFAQWLVLTAGDDILVERRAPVGIWGGLWSLPEPVSPRVGALAPQACDPGAVTEWIASRLGMRAASVEPLGEVRHAFTHFRLRAQVWAARVDGQGLALPLDHQWLSRTAVSDAPLPRPVKRLLSAGPAAQRPPRASISAPVT